MQTQSIKKISVHYYALLREERGLILETVETMATTALELYQELAQKYKFRLTEDEIKVVINEEFCPWSTVLKSGDSLAFIPPVAGGSEKVTR
jgi:sulfur-carrier protein